MKPILLLMSTALLAGVVACKKEPAEDRERAGKAREEPRPSAEPTAPAPAPAAVPPSPDAPLPATVQVDLATVTWQDGPAALPRGAQLAVVEGAPPFPAGQMFTLLIKVPEHYTVPPHRHPITERVTVLSGSLHFGHGETLDRERVTRLDQGGLLLIPARHPHYVFTGDEGAVLSVSGVGPWAISYVNPADDPRQPPPPMPDPPEIAYDTAITGTTLNARDVPYAPAPEGMLPPGAQIAVLEGRAPFDEPKTFVLRIKVPDGYRVPSHGHGVTDRVALLSGGLAFGDGETWKDRDLVEMKPGSLRLTPAGTRHYAIARGETELQVWGVGPFDIRWTHPEEDPARAGRAR